MKIFQILTTITIGDAVSNDTLAMHEILKSMGYDARIYAENVDFRIKKGPAKLIGKMPEIKPEDIVIYHLSTGTELNYEFAKMNGRKVMVYHNITPPHFFDRVSDKLKNQCQDGLNSVKFLADKVEYCICDSEFNKQNLIDMGYTCPIDVVPIIIPFEDYKKEPTKEIVEAHKKDGRTNIIFTGRIAPNKKQQDVVAAFHYYKKYYDENARLFLIGSYGGTEPYMDAIQTYINALDVEDVHVLGHISFQDILAYYSTASIFLCQSEHEGFCVPLAEAMSFDVPIVAYDEAAIKYTLGGSGVLLEEKNPLVTAGVMNEIMTNDALRQQIIANQRERLADFQYENVAEIFKKCIGRMIQ